jgi:hypothetical protein
MNKRIVNTIRNNKISKSNSKINVLHINQGFSDLKVVQNYEHLYQNEATVEFESLTL